MPRIIIKIDRGGTAHCAVCQHSMELASGLQLALADNLSPVCAGCGRQHAAPLLGLLKLAESTQRIVWKERPVMDLRLEEWLALEAAAWNYAKGLEDRPHS
jgi:hypothetical protein